jgi:hypothetical protein
MFRVLVSRFSDTASWTNLTSVPRSPHVHEGPRIAAENARLPRRLYERAHVKEARAGRANDSKLGGC